MRERRDAGVPMKQPTDLLRLNPRAAATGLAASASATLSKRRVRRRMLVDGLGSSKMDGQFVPQLKGNVLHLNIEVIQPGQQVLVEAECQQRHKKSEFSRHEGFR